MGYLSELYKFKNTFNFTHYDTTIPKLFPTPEIENKIRFDNMQILCNLFENHGISYWLIGKTLLSLYKDDTFMFHDHDDDVGIDIKDITKIPELYKDLQTHGFNVIRITTNDSMFSIMKNQRYIDICVFKEQNGKYGYEQKWYPKQLFDKYTYKTIRNFKYRVPEKSDDLLKIMYK